MRFFDFLKSPPPKPNYGKLYGRLAQELTSYSENEILRCACIAGLLARVANIDFKITPSETSFLSFTLKKWTKLKEEEISLVTKLTLEEIKDLAGLENHKYCQYLNDLLSQEEKYDLLVSLFELASSDDMVNGAEVEEIRLISTSLRLDHKFFVSAKATVLDKISTLLKNL